MENNDSCSVEFTNLTIDDPFSVARGKKSYGKIPQNWHGITVPGDHTENELHAWIMENLTSNYKIYQRIQPNSTTDLNIIYFEELSDAIMFKLKFNS